MMQALLGDEAEALLNALTHDPCVAVRPNMAKRKVKVVEGQTVPWSSLGRILTDRPAFTFDPLFHAGCYYVQEPSTLFVEVAVRQALPLLSPAMPLTVLDLCAAPGGKTTLMRSLLPDDALLVANEPVSGRLQVLLENVMKWGHPGMAVTSAQGKDFGQMTSAFDLILVDAPCSGEGMMRKEDEAARQWSPTLVEQCSKLQRRIVGDVWNALRPGGFLIYCTCTYNVEENEENVMHFCRELGAEVLPLPVDEAWGICGSLSPGIRVPVYRFMPHRVDGEGFFLALLRKTGDARSPRPETRKRKNVQFSALNSQIRPWIADGDYCSWEMDGVVHALPSQYASFVSWLAGHVHLVSAGVPVAETSKGKVRPVTALALSNLLKKGAFPVAELTYTEAIRYLRRETLVLPSSTPRGIVLVTFMGRPLGFVNNLQSRANNLYPPSWRILSAHVPSHYQPVVE
jgi:16S rRNA C967 or C1407 C5-methylase (RsmB/RsmF family)/NOL1/NOP2/fmu family ribosome biogenesis protein